MILKSGTKEKMVELTLFDQKFCFAADDDTVELCEKIRCEAKETMENLENLDDEAIVEKVTGFLKTSLEKIVGSENIAELEKCCAMTITELTGILCYAISEIGMIFADVKEPDNEQNS